jgi:serine/threonine-protein kinase RsbW
MKEYFLEISSDTKNLPRVEEHIKGIIDELNLNDELINAIMIAITEAVNNAIIHGNKREQNKMVKIHSILLDDILEIKIKDQGKGFSLNNIPNPLLPENLTKDSGRGIFIMRSLVYGFKINSYTDGTEVVMDIKIK